MKASLEVWTQVICKFYGDLMRKTDSKKSWSARVDVVDVVDKGEIPDPVFVSRLGSM